jgi:hypothetical protein
MRSLLEWDERRESEFDGVERVERGDCEEGRVVVDLASDVFRWRFPGLGLRSSGWCLLFLEATYSISSVIRPI